MASRGRHPTLRAPLTVLFQIWNLESVVAFEDPRRAVIKGYHNSKAGCHTKQSLPSQCERGTNDTHTAYSHQQQP